MIKHQSCIVHVFKQQRRIISSTTRKVVLPHLPAIAYKPEIVEKRVKYEKWEEDGSFLAANGSKRPDFSMVLPPPNVTGKLHLGHALACTVQDVIARRRRSLGDNVLWLPGTDHAGIATQGVVEKYLKSQKIDRHMLGREQFVKEVWKWRDKHGDTICEQLKILGCSLDWSRLIFTMDKAHTRAVNTAFMELFNRNLIYRKKALVNWCKALKSTISDIEIDYLSVDGPTDIKLPDNKTVKFGLLYQFAYKVFDSAEEIVVSTTLPETMLGDTAVAVHPKDERYQKFRGKRLVHPFNRKTIPIIFDDFVNMDFGTGAVKITPAHSKTDYKIASKHKLPLHQVINEEGIIENSGKFDKLDKYDARNQIVDKLDDIGLLKCVTPHKMDIPICSRTGDVIEYLPKEQWFLNCRGLNKKASEMIEKGELKIIPEKYVKNFTQWTEEDRDWCISRQLWWGHRIPAYKCYVGKDFVWVAAENEIEAKDKASQFLRNTPDSIVVERDPDVLDTWFSSGIYPFSALGWPEKTQDLKEFYPLSLMATGHDILGFWVHRMVILGLELTDKLPFNEVLLHGVICDHKGAKMSKSRGNVIDPIDVINGIKMQGLKEKAQEMCKSGILSKEEMQKALAYHKSNFANSNGIPECGIDALRFTLLTQDIKSNFVNFDVAMCHANKLFCNKIWQSIKYIQLSFDSLKPFDKEITKNDLICFDKWILSRLANMVDTVNKSMENYDFHLATKALKTFIYNEFCDVYLESTKPAFEMGNPRLCYAHAHTLSACMNASLRCLNPYMIYLTDELIPKIPSFYSNIIINYNDLNDKYFAFPKTEDFEEWNNVDTEKKVEKLLNCIKLVRELKGIYSISNKVRPIIRILSIDDGFIKDVEENKKILLNLTRCKNILFEQDTKKKYVSASLNVDTKVYVEMLADDVDKAMQTARSSIEKRVKKLEDSLFRMEAKITASSYKDNVPEWTQNADKEKLQTKKKQLEELQRLMT